MEDIFPILMFVIFLLAPILEGLKRKHKEPEKPPTRPTQRLPQQPPPQRSRVEEISTKRQDESAAAMVPDDLWEMLTGQQRMPTSPSEAPAETRRPSWDVVYEPEAELEADTAESTVGEDVEVETRRARVEAQSLETIGRHAEPVIISLEQNLPNPAARHAAFHEKIAQPVPVVERRVDAHIGLGLGDRNQLRRAFLLQEVFGKPKALE